MTREEADKLIGRAKVWINTLKQYAHEEGKTENQTEDELNLAKLIKTMLPLATLGAKVLAPTEEEIEAMVTAYDDQCAAHSGVELDSMRAALLALKGGGV